MCLTNEVFINPFTDFGFKRIFGEEESKPLLISFLNDLLPIKDKITSITFQNIEKIAESVIIYIINCIDENKKEFIVKLQVTGHRLLIYKGVHYLTFPINTSILNESLSFNSKPIYFVGILNFEVDEFSNENYIHYCQIMDTKTKQEISNKLNFIYIEIPKFKKKKEELSLHLEYWLYYLRDLPKLKEIPKEFKGDILEEAFKRAEFLKLSSKEQHNYHINLKHFRDYINTLDTALWKGKQEGLKEGEKQAKIEIAKNLLDILDTKTISIKTGLSIEEIEKLKEDDKD